MGEQQILTLSRERLADFLRHLRQEHGFDIGIREQLRAEQLRDMLASSRLNTDRWAMHIAPVVCGSAEEQRVLHEALRHYAQTIPDPALARPDAGLSPTVAGQATPAGRRWQLWLWLGFAAAALGTLIALAWWQLPKGGGKTIVEPVPRPVQPWLSFTDTSAERMLAYAAIWLVLALFVLWLWDRRLALQRSLVTQGAAPRHFGSEAMPHFAPAQVARHLHAFQARWPIGASTFAAAPTVRTASRRAGYAEPQFRRRSVAPHYLLLVRKRDWADQWTAAGLELGELLLSLGVQVDVYIYIDHPVRMMPMAEAGGDRTAGPKLLSEVLEEAPDAVAIVIEDGGGLVDSRHLALTPWAAQLLANCRLAAVMSPAVTDSWGWRERALDAAGYLVVPCDATGLAELARAVSDLQRDDVARLDPMTHVAERRADRELTGPYPPLLRFGSDRLLGDEPPSPAVQRTLIGELRDYLGVRGFLWLAALAVYPAVQPQLTREIGARLAGTQGTFDAQTYFAIVRLPWLTRDQLPDWLRRALLDALPARQERMVRGVLDAVLEQPRPHGAVLLKFASAPGLARRLRGFLTGETPPSQSDAVFARFMTGGRGLLAPRAPSWLKTSRWAAWLAWLCVAEMVMLAALGTFGVTTLSPSELNGRLQVGLGIFAGVQIAWQIVRAHASEDRLSRSGRIIAWLALPTALTMDLYADTEGAALAYVASYAVVLVLRLAVRADRLESRSAVFIAAVADVMQKPITVAAALCLPAAAFVPIELLDIDVNDFLKWYRAWLGLRTEPWKSISIFVSPLPLALLWSPLVVAFLLGRAGAPRWASFALIVSCVLGAVLFAGVSVSLAIAASNLLLDQKPPGWFSLAIIGLALGIGCSLSLQLLLRRLGIAARIDRALMVLVPAGLIWSWGAGNIEPASDVLYLLYSSPAILFPVAVAAIFTAQRSREVQYPANLLVGAGALVNAIIGASAASAFAASIGLVVYFTGAAFMIDRCLRWSRAT